jgi:hypothetical protein
VLGQLLLDLSRTRKISARYHSDDVVVAMRIFFLLALWPLAVDLEPIVFGMVIALVQTCINRVSCVQ